jgi:hypothetical protein
VSAKGAATRAAPSSGDGSAELHPLFELAAVFPAFAVMPCD